jgi:hypothetical protein
MSRPAISDLRRRMVDEALEAFGGSVTWHALGVVRPSLLGALSGSVADSQDPVSAGVGGMLCGELRREWLGMGGQVGGHNGGCGARASEAGGRGVGRVAAALSGWGGA